MVPLHSYLHVLVLSCICICNGSYPTSFDCPMRQLSLEYAQHIQPWLSTKSLKEIADALIGSPEATPCNLSIPFQHNNDIIKFESYDINTVYVDITNGIDDTINNNNIFKTIQYALNYARNHFGSNIWKQIVIKEGKYYLNNTLYLTSSDSNLIITNYQNDKVEISGAVPISKTDCKWQLYKQGSNGKNIYKCTLNKSVNISTIPGLRYNNSRAIRARYPNANPEIDGFGSKLFAASWLPPLTTQPNTTIYEQYPIRNDSINSFFQHYTIGIGGNCNGFTPNAGYWCSSKTQGGGGKTYRIPTGLTFNKTILPNSPYSSTFLTAATPIIQAWRPHHWASWMFQIGTYDAKNNTFVFEKGGFQGGRGNKVGAEFFIENVLEEVDFETEYFFDETNRILYYYNNQSNTDPSNINFEATKLKVLMNYKNVKNVVVEGITFRDTAYTYLDPHGIPSGGDWGLQRTGAILFENNNVNISIRNNLFTRLDGNCISINRYARNITIYRNEFVWIGDSVITLWGDTNSTNSTIPDGMGWIGTYGNQPRFINVSYNLAHEIGIFEKQSSLYFQAKSCQNYVGYNIFYNGPRAAINFNDGFGGGSQVTQNLLFNSCRESGDHGPFNSWDRQVYETAVLNGTSSVIKQYDYIFSNFMIADYSAVFGVDNDDDSSYYKTFSNFLVYGEKGLKNNFGGHDNHHYGNIYAYVSQACFMTNGGGNDYQLPGHLDIFSNNTCVLNGGDITNYGTLNCNVSTVYYPILGNNTIYTINETAVPLMGLCGKTEKQFQKEYRNDLNTVIYGPNQINNTALIQQAKLLLFV